MTDLFGLKDLQWELRANVDDIIKQRLRHITFCKILVYLYKTFKKNHVAYVSEIKKITLLTYTRCYQIVKDLEDFGLVKTRRISGNFIEIVPTFNEDKMKIEKYVGFAKEKLKEFGIKVKD